MNGTENPEELTSEHYTGYHEHPSQAIAMSVIPNTGVSTY